MEMCFYHSNFRRVLNRYEQRMPRFILFAVNLRTKAIQIKALVASEESYFSLPQLELVAAFLLGNNNKFCIHLR